MENYLKRNSIDTQDFDIFNIVNVPTLQYCVTENACPFELA